MHLLQSRVYAGAPGETVTVTTDVEGSGAATVFIDGQQVGEDPTFTITGNPGDETHMRISLFGAVGESCVVTISAVDGGNDGDLLLCQTLDPAPSHLYRFIVTPATAVATLESVRLSRQGGPTARQIAPPTRARKRGAKRGRSGK
jgi:hypothetical protein